jgi:large-conductance mechanosensitive channel
MSTTTSVVAFVWFMIVEIINQQKKMRDRLSTETAAWKTDPRKAVVAEDRLHFRQKPGSYLS